MQQPLRRRCRTVDEHEAKDAVFDLEYYVGNNNYVQPCICDTPIYVLYVYTYVLVLVAWADMDYLGRTVAHGLGLLFNLSDGSIKAPVHMHTGCRIGALLKAPGSMPCHALPCRVLQPLAAVPAHARETGGFGLAVSCLDLSRGPHVTL